MVVLELELPKPMFTGTPKDIKTDNLELVTGEKRKPFMVPTGTVNISADKEVTSSDDEPIIGELEMVTDGDKEGADGSFVELGPGVQWVQIDLEKEYEIQVILVWHYHAQARVYRDMVIKIANDPDFIKDVKTVFNNDHDHTAGQGIGKDYEYIESSEGKLVDCKGVKGRYVRLYSQGNTTNDMNHMIEAEVFGRPMK